MQIFEVKENKKNYLPLLLLGDEQEEMIDRYLDIGTMYVMQAQDEIAAVCVVLDAGDGQLEIKNIAVAQHLQGKGYGKQLLSWIADTYRGRYTELLAGTGDSPLTVPFYRHCGFVESHRIPNFFLDHYDHPIVEAGVLLCDMIYFRKAL